MACKTENRIINEHQYSVTQMPAERALKTQLELIGYLGSALPLIVDSFLKTGAWSFNAIEQLQQNIAKPGFYDLMKRLAMEAAKDNERITNIDLAFSGNIMDFWEVVLFVLEVNYKDFFTQLASKLKEKLAKKATA